MNNPITPAVKWGVTILTSLFVWSLLLWDHYNQGVPTHHILQSDQLPGISNWWGGIVLPIFTWIALTVIQRRFTNTSYILKANEPRNIILRGICALIFGVIISFSFMKDIPIIDPMMLALFIIALIIPLYKLEYLLGFILGTTYSFGAVIPVVFGVLLIGIYALLFHISRISWILIKSKLHKHEN